jgi:peptidoglycan/LPS O-acetylase OafA/YrhL
VAESASTVPPHRRGAIDVARVLALALVVAGHLTLAVVDRPHGTLRGANLVALRPRWALLTAVAPMPVFFVAAGYANVHATPATAARHLRLLAGLASIVVVTWSIAVIVAVAMLGRPGIVGEGARLATQPIWFVAPYALFVASGRLLGRLAARHPLASIGTSLAALALLDVARFGGGASDGLGWIGFPLAWGVPWLAGAWWRNRFDVGRLDPRRLGALIASGSIAAAIVLVHRFGYSSALIDAVPGARSNTSPPTLYTAVVGLAQAGVVLVIAPVLDRLERRAPRVWRRTGDAAVAVYLWHLTALALCIAAVAAGLPAPRRLTGGWWVTRPLWWAAVLAVTAGFVVVTERGRARLQGRIPDHEPVPSHTARVVLGVVVLIVAGAVVGLEGPRSLPLAAACSASFTLAWHLLRSPAASGGLA